MAVKSGQAADVFCYLHFKKWASSDDSSKRPGSLCGTVILCTISRITWNSLPWEILSAKNVVVFRENG